MPVIEALQAVDGALKSVAPAVGGPLGTVLAILGVALDTAIVIAQSGKDPLVEIQRIHDADPELQAMRAEWSARLAEKFGQ
jgi:hypothetical protein